MKKTTAYHPESNGALERPHRMLAEYLRHYINANHPIGTPRSHMQWLRIIQHRTQLQSYTSFELVYGHLARLPTTLSIPPKTSYTYDDYVQELKESLRATNQIAKEHLKKIKQEAKEYYYRKTKEINFKVGDKVLLYDEALRRGRSKKLNALWTGPYIVLEKVSDVNYVIKKSRRKMRTHAN